jgi:hypothetical protein
MDWICVVIGISRHKIGFSDAPLTGNFFFYFVRLMHTQLHYTMLPVLASHWLEEFANSAAETNEASETFKTCGVSYLGPEMSIFVQTI